MNSKQVKREAGSLSAVVHRFWLRAKYLAHLAHENTLKTHTILVKADQVADALNLDDELLDTLLVRLGLE